jgi:hypothetical protein
VYAAMIPWMNAAQPASATAAPVSVDPATVRRLRQRFRAVTSYREVGALEAQPADAQMSGRASGLPLRRRSRATEQRPRPHPY